MNERATIPRFGTRFNDMRHKCRFSRFALRVRLVAAPSAVSYQPSAGKEKPAESLSSQPLHSDCRNASSACWSAAGNVLNLLAAFSASPLWRTMASRVARSPRACP